MRMSKPAWVGAISALCLLVSGGTWAVATSSSPGIPSPDGVFSACYDNGGNVKLIATEATCPKGYSGPVTWNQRGPQGQQGVPGVQGPEGQQGPQGPRGEAGADGTLASLDDVSGVPCRIGTPEEGVVTISYDDEGLATMRCAPQGWVSIRGLNGGAVTSGTQVVTQGVVTMRTSNGYGLWLQEPGTGLNRGMIVTTPASTVFPDSIQPGDRVQVTGTYTANGSAEAVQDIVQGAQATVLGTAPVPDPVPVSPASVINFSPYNGMLVAAPGPWTVGSSGSYYASWRVLGPGNLYMSTFADPLSGVAIGDAFDSVTGGVMLRPGQSALYVAPRSPADIPPAAPAP